MTAPIRGMSELVTALRQVREERGITNEVIDEISGLQSGYTGKLLSPRPARSLGLHSLGPVLGAVGKALIMVDDPDQIKRVKNRWQKRKRIHSKAAEQASRASMAGAIQEMQQFQAKLELSERMKQLAKLGASKGGKARAKAMSKRARQQVARTAALARWAKAEEAKKFKDGKGKKRKAERDRKTADPSLRLMPQVSPAFAALDVGSPQSL